MHKILVVKHWFCQDKLVHIIATRIHPFD
jgi:hypothetical protein